MLILPNEPRALPWAGMRDAFGVVSEVDAVVWQANDVICVAIAALGKDAAATLIPSGIGRDACRHVVSSSSLISDSHF